MPQLFNPAETSVHPIRNRVASLGPFPLWNSFPRSFLQSLEALLPSGIHPVFQYSNPHQIPLPSPQVPPANSTLTRQPG